ncbi:MAG TPA: DUF1732 domain-containing protein, partial [Candidatus Brocadiia bacterium]|nr:DUF1732 domain-containing protein [Candidatus Brocadiia bacterium]
QKMVEACLREACAGMTAMREEEGRFLWNDILERCAVIEKLLAKVEARVPGMLDEFRERLAKRLSLLLAKMGDELRPEEIHREIALYTDRSDINEEISRMRSHLAQMRDCPASKEPVGRRIEFIVQEMFREANTMGSKSNDPDMIHDIVDMKSELEKLREQAFNIE